MGHRRNQSFARSIHFGFVLRIRATFFLRVHRFNSFSREIAATGGPIASKYTRRCTRYAAVKPILDVRCSCSRRRRSFVTPTYRTRDLLARM